MYVTDSRACSLPNSSTPMTAAAIARQDARIQRVGDAFVAGNRTLEQLNNSLGGNYINSTRGDSGVPTRGAGWKWPPAVGQVAEPGPCVAPQILPMASIFPIPVVASRAVPAAPVNPWGSVQSIAGSAPVIPPPAPRDCRTGDICRDLRSGCVQQVQVSPQQLFACSQAGYAGNEDRFAGGAAGGAYLGSPDLNPAPAAGVSGVTSNDEGSGAFWGGLALAAFTLYALRDISRRRTR